MRTYRKKLTGLSESNSETSNTHQCDAGSNKKQIDDTGLDVAFPANIGCELRNQEQEYENVNDGRLSIESSTSGNLQPKSNRGILDQDIQHRISKDTNKEYRDGEEYVSIRYGRYKTLD
jgi:hypothetical protein